MEHDTTEPVVVRDPAEFAREEQARYLGQAAEERRRIETFAADVAQRLVTEGARNQTVNHNHEFVARVPIGPYAVRDTKALKARVEELVHERLGDTVTIFVGLVDTRNSYDGSLDAMMDITIWATPKKS